MHYYLIYGEICMKRNKTLLILGTAVLLVLQTVFGAYATEEDAP